MSLRVKFNPLPVRPQEESGTVETTPPDSDFPRDVARHSRYKSPWSSNQVEIDVGNFTKLEPNFRIFDLEKIYLNCDIELGGVYDGIKPLTDFPHLADAFKRAINLYCENHHHGGVTSVTNFLRIIQSFFSWMVSRGIYRLRDLEQSDMEQVLNDVAQHTWSGLNNLDGKLRDLIETLNQNPSLAPDYVGKGMVGTFTVSTEKLESTLGIPIASQTIPKWFRDALKKVSGDKRPNRTKGEAEKPSFSRTMMTAKALDFLANPGGITDGIQFKPYESGRSAALSRIVEKSRQTPNISPTDACKIISECFTWLFDYGSKIVASLLELRTELERDYSDTPQADAKIRDLVKTQLENLVRSGEIPGQILGIENCDFADYAALTMIACGQLIGINHARRAKEIYGSYNVGYGAYFGCVQLIDAERKAYTSEFWVSKGVQDWRSFPANGLVADAIALLEQFYLVYRKFGEKIPPSDDKQKLRQMKLFSYRRLTLHSLQHSEPLAVPHLTYTRYLFIRAGVNPEKWASSSSPFRRMYVQLYMRRYDLPELPAAARQLGHQGFPQTIHYGSNTKATAPGESVREIFPQALDKDSKDLLKNIKEEGAIYLRELIEGLFKGSGAGGLFPRRVIKLAQRLSSIADFSKLSVDRKAGILAQRLDKQGYAITPMPHVACTAGSNKQTIGSANCAKDGQLQRKMASPSVCSGCFHSWTTENYRKNILDEAETMRANAALETTPAVVARELEFQAQEYVALVEKDCAISEDTQKLIESYSRHFNNQLRDDE